jgi:hypothetical protein
VLLVVHIGLFNQKMKNFCEIQHQHGGELYLLMCGASLFSNLLLDRQKDEYLCSFFEVFPMLVIRHSSQPVFRYLLRLAAAVVVVVVFVEPLLLPPQNTLQNR